MQRRDQHRSRRRTRVCRVSERAVASVVPGTPPSAPASSPIQRDLRYNTAVRATDRHCTDTSGARVLRPCTTVLCVPCTGQPRVRLDLGLDREQLDSQRAHSIRVQRAGCALEPGLELRRILPTRSTSDDAATRHHAGTVSVLHKACS